MWVYVRVGDRLCVCVGRGGGVSWMIVFVTAEKLDWLIRNGEEVLKPC